jgi:peroxiredoxin
MTLHPSGMPPLRLEDLVDQPVPDLALPDSAGGMLRLREGVGHRALVLFFYLMNGTPT